MRTIFLGAIMLMTVGAAADVAATPPISLDTLDQAIDDAAGYLVRHTTKDGRFVYRINLDPSVTVAPRYNLLRHAGTIYALADYHQLRPHETTQRVLHSAGGFLHAQIADLGEVPDVRAVWSDPKVNGSNENRQAKLGATGLGLVALTRLERIRPGFTPADELKPLGNFLLFMQKDDGSFYSMYYSDFPGRDDTWTSLYYPGEAALGLLLLHELIPDPEWVSGANEVLMYLAQKRAGQETVPADHWALLATAKVLSWPASERKEINTTRLIAHAVQICKQMMVEQQPQNNDPRLQGSFVADGRTTPTATRLEGLQAALSFLPEAEFAKLRRDIEAACRQGVLFLLNAQIQEGRAAGGIPRAVARLPMDDPLWSASFNQRATEIRIDYVQHALSAWMQYRGRLISKSHR